MPERIYKLQPNRTMALRGFDHLGASGSMHSAAVDSFKVTGNFRDASDFCVLALWDVDDFFGHPRIKYLPDSSFAGLVLTFNVQYTGLQTLDSTKFATIDWPYLDVIAMDATHQSIRLSNHATPTGGGTYASASAVFSVVDSGLQPFDRITLWYQNITFDYIVPNPATGVTAATIAANLAAQINAIDYAQAGAPIGLTAAAVANQITVTAALPGVDGNMIQLYQLNKNSNLAISPAVQKLAGGDSGAIWQVTLDFTALGLSDLRKMWLTFAPALADSSAYPGGDWEASFTNWILTGPEDTRKLQVAGLNTVRVQQSDSGCSYSGSWTTRTDFYDQAFGLRGTGIGTTARIAYSSAVTHDVYIGTLLSPTAGLAGIQLDGDAETDLNCALGNSDIVITRRKVRASVPAGQHVLTMVLKLGESIDFNFLEAAFPSDLPTPLPARASLSAALDFDTDHTYKLPPARILWMFDQLGLNAPINEYLGVFWWNQRVVSGNTVPSLTVTFAGSWTGGDSIFLDIGAPQAADPTKIDRTQQVSTMSKSVFPTDTSATIAAHFCAFINETFSGIWAATSAGDLVVSVRSASYAFALEVNTETQTVAGTVTLAGSLAGGVLGDWIVDPSQTPTVNTGARAWHSDFYALAQARGTGVITSISMELVNPPVTYPARFNDGSPVSTATGFGSYVSTHCALAGPILAFQQTVLTDLAALQTAAGLTPALQLGEFLWWFFASPGTPQSMAYYDAGTIAAAQVALGRPLALFTSPNQDPTVNASADAIFLRNRLRDHVASLVAGVRTAYPTARIEVLLPVDVNYSTPVGPVGAQVGGQLNAFINIPTEWLSLATAGFDFLKIEALSFGSTTRSLDLARSAISSPVTISWPGDDRRYLVPVFGTASPWQKEVGYAFTAGYSVVSLWAFDHICLYGWDITAEAFSGAARSSYQG